MLKEVIIEKEEAVIGKEEAINLNQRQTKPIAFIK